MVHALVPISPKAHVIDEKRTPGLPPSVSESLQLRPLSTGIEITPLSHTHTCVPIEAALQSQLEPILAPRSHALFLRKVSKDEHSEDAWMEPEAQKVADAMRPLTDAKQVDMVDFRKLFAALKECTQSEIRVESFQNLFRRARRVENIVKRFQKSEREDVSRLARTTSAMLRRIIAVASVVDKLTSSGRNLDPFDVCPPSSCGAMFAERYLVSTSESTLLGKGGFGSVRVMENATHVAIKTCGLKKTTRDDLLREAGMFSLLDDSIAPGVCGWFDSTGEDKLVGVRGSASQVVKMPMDRVLGLTLKEEMYMLPSGRFWPEEVISISEKLKKHIEAVHARGIGLSDLKEANIMVVGKQLYLIDGGGFQFLGKPIPAATYFYCSPKTIYESTVGDTNAQLTVGHDYWTLGNTLLNLATGQILARTNENKDGFFRATQRWTRERVRNRVRYLISNHAIGTSADKRKLEEEIMECFHDSEFVAASRGGGEGE